MPSNGVLGVTFTCVRILEALCTIPIIGIISNFISQAISSNQAAPQVLIGILSIASIALIYAAITFILYLDSMLPFLIIALVDGLVLIAMIVVAVVIGQPLTYLNCLAIGNPSAAGNMYEFTSALGTGSGQSSTGGFDLAAWLDSSEQICLEMKSVWGLDISLCVLFGFSIMCSLSLWRQKSAVKPASKGGEV